MTHEEWLAEARRIFGDNPREWKWVCPICGKIMSLEDYRQAGAPNNEVAVSCITRWLPGGCESKSPSPFPNQVCNYAGYGLIRANPIHIVDKDTDTFAFADPAPGQ